MATVSKDFKLKNGLIVEGSNATVAGYDILTKATADQNYIIGLIGGSATADATPDTVVLRDEDGSFAANTVTAHLVGDVTGNADTASMLETARTISLTGDVTGSVSFDGSQNVSITATVDSAFATDSEVATAKQEAIDAAESDATTKANAAENNAKAYTDDEILTALATAANDATSKANAAEASANSYTDDLVGQEVLDRNSAISSAIATEVTDRDNAISAAITNLNLSGTYDALGAADQALLDAQSYADQKVADLVDGAPALLDTLNEIAAAIGDDANYFTTVAEGLSQKADTTYVDSEISDLDSAAQGYAASAESNAITSANSYTNQEIAAEASARDAAISSAISTEVTNRNSAIDSAIATEVNDRNDAIATAISSLDASSQDYVDNAIAQEVSDRDSAISTAINALDTDDIEEGTSNLYFTDGRAKDSAASLLTTATLTNITITGTGNGGLTITAENGVADSTTDDLEEGNSNLYFTDSRAVSALEAVTPNFPAVEIASVAKQVAASAEVATASTNTAVSWAKSEYRSAEFLVKIANGSHTEVSKVILTLDSSDNIAITEYAMVGTNGALGSVSADVSGSDVRIRVATDFNNSTVTVVGTLLA